jgi:transcriptional regulator with XRE-family HTH domain
MEDESMPATKQTRTKRVNPLGQVMRGIRAVVGVTQASHAEAAGIVPAYLSRLESGEKKTSHRRLLELLAALRLGRQDETQARLAILHGDGLLTAGELAVLVAYNGCRPVICLYKSHATYGDQLETCPTCGRQVLCRPEGHECPNTCGGDG